jgi:pantothenate synthetase
MIADEKIRNAEIIRQKIRSKIETAPDMKIDYIAVANPKTLDELTTIDSNSEAVILIAARIGITRLIDNIMISRTE